MHVNDSEPYGPGISLTVANTNAIRIIIRAFSKQATDEVFPTNPSPTQAPFHYQRLLRSSLRHHHFLFFRKLPGRMKSDCGSLRNLTLLLTFQNPLAPGGQAVNDPPCATPDKSPRDKAKTRTTRSKVFSEFLTAVKRKSSICNKLNDPGPTEYAGYV